MTTYVPINLRVVYPTKQALIALVFRWRLKKQVGRSCILDLFWIMLKAMCLSCRLTGYSSSKRLKMPAHFIIRQNTRLSRLSV